MKRLQSIKYRGLTALWIPGLVLVISLLTGCDDPNAQPPAPVESISTAGAPPTETAIDHHLQVVALDDIKRLIAETAEQDQVLVIDFWATWCVPCVEMFPSLHEGLVARKGPVRAVTVTLDDPSREPAAVAFLSEHDALHDAFIFENDSAAQQALADGLGESWNNLAVPAILVYDSTGQLSAEFLEGGSTQAILDHVDYLLASDQEP